MKKLISIYLFVFATLSTFAQVPNGGFETWVPYGVVQVPSSWNTTDSISFTNPIPQHSAMQEIAEVQSGTASLRLTSWTFYVTPGPLPFVPGLPGCASTGSVIIDVSVDQGGCIETSEVTSHEKPTRIVHGVVHYGVPNIASKVSRTASIGISNIITTFLQQAGDSGSIEKIIYDYKGLRNGIYTYKGCLTNEYLAQRFGIKYTNLDLLLTSGI